MQRRRYRRRFRWLATGLTFVLVPVLLTPIVTAQNNSAEIRQSEVATFELTTDGIVGEAEFTEELRTSFDSRMTVELPSTLSDVKASDGAPDMSEQDSELEFRVDGKGPNDPVDFAVTGSAELTNSRGTVKTPSGDRQLPINISTKFRLDDTPVQNLADIEGMSGDFEMEIFVENRAGVAENVTFKDAATGDEFVQAGFVFMPLTVAMGPWYLDDGNWSNVVVDNMVAEQVGDQTVIGGGQILAPPTLPGSVTARMSARVESFDLNSARILAVPGIDAELPSSVVAAQTEGGSRTALIFTALTGFMTAFNEALEPEPAEALPFLQNTAAGGATTAAGAATTLVGIQASALSTIAGLITTINGFDLESINGTLNELLGTLAGTLGSSTYTTPSCRPDLVPESLCNLNAWQVPEIPPFPPLSGKGPFAAVAENPATGQTELYPRTTSSLGNFVATPSLGNNEFSGSIYNWATLLKEATEQPYDVTGDGTADFPAFIWPNPAAKPEIYTTQGINTVAINAGEIFPGAGTIVPATATSPERVFEGVNATFATPSEVFTGVCSLDIQDTPSNGVWFKEFSVDCFNGGGQIGLPAQDVTLGDLLTGAAEQKIGTALATLDACASKEVGGQEVEACEDGQISLQGEIKFGELVVNETQRGLQNTLARQPVEWPIECFDFKSANTEKIEALTLKGLVQVLCGKDARPFTPGTTSTAEYNGEGFKSPDVVLSSLLTVDPLTIELNIIPFLPAYDEGCFYPVGLFLPGQASGDDPAEKLNCDWTQHGQLKTTSAWAEAIQDKIYSSAWNFDNWLRGDPGFQAGDVALTAPALEQMLSTIVPFDISRGAAKCPSVIVTSPGSGTPRVRPPARDTTCDTVLADTSTPPQTLLGNVEAMASAIAGPGGILEATATFLRSLDPLVPFLNETAAALTSIADRTQTLIDRLTLSRSLDERLLGQIATLQEAGDLATAVTQKGIEIAESYQPFMGPATYDGKQASARVILGFEVQGVKP